jgi:hypothetical protein
LAIFRISCDFGEQHFLVCQKVADTQRKGHFTTAVYFGWEILIQVKFAAGFIWIVIPT